jgi:uncharacterized protein with gpF-like domain
MTDRRRQLRAWLLAMTRYELMFRSTVARTRNAFIRSASESYKANHAFPGWLRTAHEKRLSQDLGEHYQKVIPAFGAMALQQIKSRRISTKAADNLFTGLMAEWVKREALRKAKIIAATDADDVRDTIQDGLEEGLGTEEIARNIRKVSELTPFRAATVARTETHTAATFGSIESVREAERALGVVMLKEWLPTMDDRTRPEHAAMAGSDPIPMGEKFHVGGELMDRPGDSSASAENQINCRCGIAYSEAE